MKKKHKKDACKGQQDSPKNTPKHGQTYAATTFDLFVCALTHLHVVVSVGFMHQWGLSLKCTCIFAL